MHNKQKLLLSFSQNLLALTSQYATGLLFGGCNFLYFSLPETIRERDKFSNMIPYTYMSRHNLRYFPGLCWMQESGPRTSRMLHVKSIMRTIYQVGRTLTCGSIWSK